jgi:hypothetical protein
MVFLWWPIVPVTHCVSVETRSPSGWYDGVEVTTRCAPYVPCGADAYCHPIGRITQRFPKYMRRLLGFGDV